MAEPIPLREVHPLVPTCCGTPMQRVASPSGAMILVCNRCGVQKPEPAP